MVNIPKDPTILLGYINTQLRDYYPSLEEFCLTTAAVGEDIEKSLAVIDYHYDYKRNQFV